MPSPKRIVLEKSRTVRRRYQRSNQRLEFSASQIARIEREEAREKRAKQLREREKKRVANKKKKAEKEAAEREERRKQGRGGLLADQQCAEPVPSSQPLLSRFLMKRTVSTPVEAEAEAGSCSPQREEKGEDEDIEKAEFGFESSPGSSRRESLGEFEEFDEEGEESLLADLEGLEGLEDLDDLDGLSDDTIIAGLENGLLQDGTVATENVGTGDIRKGSMREKDDDEFSDCSIFYDEDLIKEADSMATTAKTQPAETSDRPVPIGLPVEESFRDDTADLLEEFAHEFDTDEEFERELVQLDAV